MKKRLPLFAGITLLAGVSAVNAGELQLTTAQLDNVTAGVLTTTVYSVTNQGRYVYVAVPVASPTQLTTLQDEFVSPTLISVDPVPGKVSSPILVDPVPPVRVH